MSEEKLLKYMQFTENEVIFNKDFYENVILICMENGIDYQERIDKAIEYVEDYKDQWIRNDEVTSEMNNLLSILKGEDKE